jgi:hypothetical protein
LSNLAAGNYSLTVTEIGGLGCQAITSIDITEPEYGVTAAVVISENSGGQANDGTLCSSDIAMLSTSASPSPGATISSYLWSTVPAAMTAGINVSTPATYTVTVTDSKTCTATASAVITLQADNTAGAASAAPTSCMNAVLPSITHTTTGATGIGTATGLPSGVSASWAANLITISGTPAESGVFSYNIPLTGGCGTVSATGTITITPANTVGAASGSPTLCTNTLMSNITHATSGATGVGTPSGLPSGVTASWAANQVTLSGTPTESGLFIYSVPLTGGCGNVNATGIITVTPVNTVSAASSAPSLCVNTALTDITHTTTGAIGIGTPTGLPAGVTAAWASNLITISGTPVASGVYNYSIPLTGGCGNINAAGTITVLPPTAALAASATPTLCLNTPLTNITHATLSATGIGTPSGLPAGVSASWNADLITISGTPTEVGVFSYSIPLTGLCGSANATGTITVNLSSSVGAASATPTVCPSTAMTSITHTTTSASGIGTPTNLPAGVTASWSSDVITISGMPTASGVFNYEIPLTGGCGTVSATGTITVRPSFSAGEISATGQQICSGAGPIEIGSVSGASGGDGNIVYSWRASTDGYVSAISGAESETYTPPSNLAATTTYRRYANDGICIAAPSQSTGA